MAELIIGASYPAKRSGAIVVGESKQGALMAYIPFVLTGGIAFTGNHSVCIGSKDGTLQERNIESLRKIFGWQTENPFDLQRIPIAEGDAPEFVLADYHNEPYTPNGKTEQVDSFKFRWLNELGSGIAPATDEQEQAALAKWGKKFSFTPKAETAKPVEKPVEKPAEKKTAPKREVPAKKAARTAVAEEVYEALLKKHAPKGDEEIINEFWWPTLDAILGNGKTEGTPEQWGQIADKLGV